MKSRLLASIAWLFAAATLSAADSRPNVILILADDMGFSDLGCYGGEIKTPNLDALARGGVRFSQFYNTARCCPTRASLLTGLYPHQAGVGHMVDAFSKRQGEGYAGDLNKQCVTIAEVLKPAGYSNYAVGKWHVTPFDQNKVDRHNWPLQRGFDRFYGTIHGAGSFFDPYSLVRDNEVISAFADPEYYSWAYYYTDAISDHAVRYVRDHARHSKDKPFFMYVAYTAAHWPMHARAEDAFLNRGKYDKGYEPVREARFKRSKELGLIDPKWELTPQSGDWGAVKNKPFESRCMEVYAAMITRMDEGIGWLAEELVYQGLLDNTLILFLQDNGACAEMIGRNGEFKARADKPTLQVMAAEEFQTNMIPKQSRTGFPVRQGYGVMPGDADTFVAYGREWANVSNTPFREYKHWVHEGGISTPLIAHWPKGIPASRTNVVEKQPGHLIDIMATCADLAGAKYPAEANGGKITPFEGVSLRPAFEGKPLARKEPLFWEHEGNRAVRDGKWKLVAKSPAGKWELYDMDADRTELHDLAGENPHVVKELTAKWETWARRANVLPWTWDPPYGEIPKPGAEKKAAKKQKK